MFKVLRNKPLWVHIILALGLTVFLLFLFLLSLDWITNHGESTTVPTVTGKTISQAEGILEKSDFALVLQDSVYYDSLPPGMIIKQVPEADEVVKINRTVYVTVNRFIAPDVELPRLNGFSYRNAEMVLRNVGLKIGDTSFKPDFAKNTVLEVLFRGQPVQPGAKVKMGSTIDLVLGSGVGDEFVPVPDLVGKTYEEARALLDAQGIIYIPIAKAGVTDTAAAFVYQQRPAPRTLDGKRLSIRAGQMVDLFLQIDPPAGDSSQAPLPPVTNQQDQP